MEFRRSVSYTIKMQQDEMEVLHKTLKSFFDVQGMFSENDPINEHYNVLSVLYNSIGAALDGAKSHGLTIPTPHGQT